MERATRTKSGFTLVEALVAITIVAILAAILFPVFRAAKGASIKTVCLSNFRQVQLTTQMYLSDYDDRFPLVNYNVQAINDPSRDRTWVQLLMPYLRSFGSFQCPGDSGLKPSTASLFDGDLQFGDTYRRYYRASLRSNVGYNYLYFSPVYRLGSSWVIQPKSTSEIADSGQSLMFIDSVYDRTPSGVPTGGGSYIVIPPCRFTRIGSTMIDTFNIPSTASIYTPNVGWLVNSNNSAFRYGLAWAWHNDRTNVGGVSGGASSIPISKLSEGCSVQNNWAGIIEDPSKYPWD